MKKIIAFATGAAALAFATSAQANTVEMELTGEVEEICGAFDFQANPVLIDFGALSAIEVGSQTPEVVNGLTIVCNVAAGGTVNITSQNGGVMERDGTSGGPNNEVGYTVRATGGSGLTFASTTLASDINLPFNGSPAYLAGQTRPCASPLTASARTHRRAMMRKPPRSTPVPTPISSRFRLSRTDCSQSFGTGRRPVRRPASLAIVKCSDASSAVNWGAVVQRLFAKLLAAAALVMPTSIAAIDVQPLRVMLEPAVGRTAVTFAVSNPRDEALPVEIRVERRIIGPDGQQTFEPVEGDFVVFPVQSLIPADGSQAVRVQYVGDRQLSQTAGYILRVSEVPVIDPAVSGIQFAYSFGAAVYVKPAGAASRIVVDSSRMEDGRMVLELRNIGNDFALLTEKRLRFMIGDQAFDLSGDALRTLIPNALVAPASGRRLELLIPDLPTGEPIDVTID